MYFFIMTTVCYIDAKIVKKEKAYFFYLIFYKNKRKVVFLFKFDIFKEKVLQSNILELSSILK